MRIVWFAAAILAGVATALAWGATPGDLIPHTVFWAICLGTSALIVAGILLRRDIRAPLVFIVILFGMWRVSAGPQELVDLSGISSDLLNGVRLRISETLARVIGGDEGGLATALLTGVRAGLSTELVEAFRAAGLSHVLAISGLHVSLIGGAAITASTFAMGRQGRYYLIVPALAVIGYAALAGFAPPTTRAAIMFLAFIAGRMLGRGSYMLPAIALAATTMVLLQPKVLMSLSFQLSFAAVLGIALVARRFDLFAEVSSGGSTTSERNSVLFKLKRFLAGSLTVSVAATLATVPLVAIHFDAVPIWGPIATLFVLPALPVLIVSSLLASAVDVVAPQSVAFLAAMPALVAARYSIFTAELLGRVPPGPFSTDSLGLWFAAVYYPLLFIAATRSTEIASFVKRSFVEMKGVRPGLMLTGKLGSASPYVLFFLLLIAGLAMWAGAMNQPQDRLLSVTFLSLARGESILIEAPNGNRMLVDAGGTPDGAADALQDLIPPWDRRIDAVLVTHPDADHLAGMSEVVKRFEVGVILDPELNSESATFANWQETVNSHGNTSPPVDGMEIRLDQDVSIEFLTSGCDDLQNSCANRNDASVVVKVVYREVSFLLTGDIEADSELQLIDSGRSLEATVLKVPHHGSRTSSSEPFIASVSPSVAVVAVGTENPFGHPHEEVWERLTDIIGEERLYRTDIDGTIRFQTDGSRLWKSK